MTVWSGTCRAVGLHVFSASIPGVSHYWGFLRHLWEESCIDNEYGKVPVHNTICTNQISTAS